MALAIYEQIKPGYFKKISEVGDTERNPIITTHNGKTGDNIQKKFYIRNDNPSYYYTDIILVPNGITDTDGDDYIDGTTTGWGVKLYSGSTMPTEDDWENISYGNQITFSNIGSSSVSDTSTCLPFWYRVECPENSSIKAKEDIQLTLEYKENYITGN